MLANHQTRSRHVIARVEVTGEPSGTPRSHRASTLSSGLSGGEPGERLFLKSWQKETSLLNPAAYFHPLVLGNSGEELQELEHTV